MAYDFFDYADTWSMPDSGSYYDYADIGSVGSWDMADYANLTPFQPTPVGGDMGMGQSFVPPAQQFQGAFGAGPSAFGGGFGGGPAGAALTQPTAAGGAPAPAGGGGAPTGAPQGTWMDRLLNPSTLLGLGGGIAGLAGTLINQGQGPTSKPVIPTAQRAMIDQSQQALQPFATGTSPLQQMQMSLLQSLAGGQGLPAGYQQLVEQAFQPQLGDIYTQAANAGRSRGFHDAPATSPPGGAIMGPALSNVQGQMAAAKLGLMQSLPGLFNQPIGTQASAAGNQAQNLRLGAGMGIGQTTQQPIAPLVANQIGAGLQGLGQALAPNPFEQALKQAQNSGMGITLSGART